MPTLEEIAEYLGRELHVEFTRTNYRYIAELSIALGQLENVMPLQKILTSVWPGQERSIIATHVFIGVRALRLLMPCPNILLRWLMHRHAERWKIALEMYQQVVGDDLVGMVRVRNLINDIDKPVDVSLDAIMEHIGPGLTNSMLYGLVLGSRYMQISCLDESKYKDRINRAVGEEFSRMKYDHAQMVSGIVFRYLREQGSR